MARKRLIDPAIWNDEKFCALSVYARLLFLCMVNHADDGAKARGSAKYWRSACFSEDVDEIKAPAVQSYIKEITEKNMMLVYEINKEEYLWVVNFHRHQVLNRPRQSEFPHPSLDALKEVGLLEIYLEACYKLRQRVPKAYLPEDLSVLKTPKQRKKERLERQVVPPLEEQDRVNKEGLSKIKERFSEIRDERKAEFKRDFGANIGDIARNILNKGGGENQDGAETDS